MPQPMLFILALADIFSGILLYFHPDWLKLLFYFAFLCLAKGGWSLIAAFSSRFYFDFLGLLDILAGIFLLLLYYKITAPFLGIVGIMLALKGIWSLFFSVSSS